MKKLRLLIVGSNFGASHLRAANASNKFRSISITSPNINEKKISNRFFKFQNYINALNKNNYDMITVATKPQIQHELVNFLFKNNKIPKYLFLEKPILNKTIKILKKFKKKKFFLTNFIFTFDKSWKKFFQISNNNNNYLSINYKWYFEQAFFKNLKKTWKINENEGGGLVNFYLSHVIYNLLNLNTDLTFKKVIDKKFYKKKLVFLNLSFLLNKKTCNILISNKSKTRIHLVELIYKSKKIELKNSSKNWIKGFRITSEKKRNINKNFEKNDPSGRVSILLDLYSNLKKYYDVKFIENNNRLTYKTFEIINNINKQVKK